MRVGLGAHGKALLLLPRGRGFNLWKQLMLVEGKVVTCNPL